MLLGRVIRTSLIAVMHSPEISSSSPMSRSNDAVISRLGISDRVAALTMLPRLPWVLAALCVLLILSSLGVGYSLGDCL